MPQTDTQETFPVAQQVPTFKTKAEERKWLLEQMAGAFRIFGRQGFCVGTAGHISVRDPENRDTFWLNPLGQHFSTLKASDMVLVNEEGDVIGGSKRPVNKAGFKIHGALHKARPDVNAACHTHSIYGRAYSAFGKELDMINQDDCAFYENHTVYKSFGGVVLSDEEGQHIANALGNKTGLILQNHGLLSVGDTVAEAAAFFLSLEEACHAQLLVDASQHKPVLISHEAAKFTRDATVYPGSYYGEFLCYLELEDYLDPSYKN